MNVMINDAVFGEIRMISIPAFHHAANPLSFKWDIITLSVTPTNTVDY